MRQVVEGRMDTFLNGPSTFYSLPISLECSRHFAWSTSYGASCMLVKNAGVQSKLRLHERYQAERKKLTDKAFVDENTKTEFQTMLEKHYADIDVKVRHVQYAC